MPVSSAEQQTALLQGAECGAAAVQETLRSIGPSTMLLSHAMLSMCHSLVSGAKVALVVERLFRKKQHASRTLALLEFPTPPCVPCQR